VVHVKIKTKTFKNSLNNFISFYDETMPKIKNRTVDRRRRLGHEII